MKHEPTAFRPQLLREAIAHWVACDMFTHALTLNINRMAPGERAVKRLLGSFCQEVDRFKLGRRRVHEVSSGERFQAIALLEKPLGKSHLHLAGDFGFAEQLGIDFAGLSDWIDRTWLRLTRHSGSAQLVPIRDAGWSWYITKDFVRNDGHYLLAADFHRV